MPITEKIPIVSPERCFIKFWNNQSEIQKPGDSHHVTDLKFHTSQVSDLKNNYGK
jgi:hypothetical protein